MRRRATLSGRRPLHEIVEPVVRAALAHRLGVELAWLSPAVSLRDDLAADPLNLLEVVIEIEATLAIHVPEWEIERVRTVADLVRIAAAHLWERDHPPRAARPGRAGVAA